MPDGAGTPPNLRAKTSAGNAGKSHSAARGGLRTHRAGAASTERSLERGSGDRALTFPRKGPRRPREDARTERLDEELHGGLLAEALDVLAGEVVGLLALHALADLRLHLGEGLDPPALPFEALDDVVAVGGLDH